MLIGKTLRVLQGMCDIEVGDTAQFEKLYIAGKLQSKLYESGGCDLRNRDLEIIVGAIHMFYTQHSGDTNMGIDDVINASYHDFVDVYACEVEAFIKDVSAKLV